ncbi:MAG: hypothetical protein MRY79_05465 [Alphaproteobacteria bacterium]|nr:hypothetical protein [Alphaproteobacteria bacterium]
MFPEYNAIHYFIDLLALCLILVPALYFIPQNSIRRGILAFMGAYLLYFIAPRLVLFYVLFWLVIYVLQRLVCFTTDKKFGTAVFWISLLTCLAPMIFWKLNYEEFSTSFNLITNDLLSYLSNTIWTIDLARAIIIPIGLSFATFRAADLLIKSWLGKFEKLSALDIFFYGLFPPVQIVGPIIEYEEIDKYNKPKAQDFYDGLMRIAFGLVKVLLLATLLQKSASIFGNYETAQTFKIWGFLFIYTWFFYLNFSGYSDLAIGISRMLGYKLKENFGFPYFRRNITEFWNNWHMSLSRFAQRNAFVPLGGYRKETQYLAVLATIFVIALWHDISWGMVIFAAYHGAGLIIHRLYSDRIATKERDDNIFLNALKIFGTYLFVTLSFPLLVLPLEKAGAFYLSLGGF